MMKVAAIANAPAPRNVQELRAYLGLLNFYGNVIGNLSTVLQPLHVLVLECQPPVGAELDPLDTDLEGLVESCGVWQVV